jgi:hypothetical protein
MIDTIVKTMRYRTTGVADAPVTWIPKSVFDRSGRIVVAQPANSDETPLQEKLRGQCRDDQIKPLDPQTRQAEGDANHAGHETGDDNPNKNVDRWEKR